MAELFEALDAPADEPASAPEPTIESEAPATESPPETESTETQPIEAEAPAPEPPPAPAPAPEPSVPVATLLEERRRYQERIDALEKRSALSPEDTALLARLRDQQKAAEPAIPDFETDPKGHLEARLKQVSEQNEQVKQATQALVASQQEQAVINQATVHEQAFVSEHPDYYDALKHIRSVRTEQLRMIAPDADANTISTAIRREEVQMVNQLIAGKKNPAEFAYNYARTLGYKAAAAAAAAPAAAPAPAALKPPAPPIPVDRTAVRTLGAGAATPPTAEDEADGMPEFKAALRERFKVH